MTSPPSGSIFALRSFVPRAAPAAGTPTRPLLYAFVDETGDRGYGPRASRFFSMAGLLVPAEDLAAMSHTIIGIKQRFGVLKQEPLHWVKHVRQFARRQYVTTELLKHPNMRVNYVIFEKAGIPTNAHLGTNQSSFYNYTAALLMERLLLGARDWPGGMRDVRVDFGHVRGFNHLETLSYFQIKKEQGQGPAPWSLLEGTPRFAAMNANSGLQAADQYAGMLAAAIVADPFGGYEPQHLLRIRPQIRRSAAGIATGYGFKVMGRANTMLSLPWWPAAGM